MASLAVFFIITLLAVSSLSGTAVAVEPTAEPLPFSGGTNTISGKVLDSSGNGIPGAKVTLYNAVWVPYDYKATDRVRIAGLENPQQTSDGSVLPAGAYVFTGIPSGAYTLTAEKGGISISENIQVTGGATTKNLVISGYIENYSTPTPLPSKTPTGWPTAAPTGAPGPDFGAVLFEVFRALLMGVIGVQLVVSIVVIAMQLTRRQ